MESSQLESPIDAQAFALLTTFAFWGGVVCAVLGLHGERANGWGVTVPPALAGLFLNICGAFGGLLLLPFASS